MLQTVSRIITNFFPHSLSRFTTAIVIRIAYGHEVTSNDDHYLKMTGEIGAACNNSGPIGNTPIDWLPIRELTSDLS